MKNLLTVIVGTIIGRYVENIIYDKFKPKKKCGYIPPVDFLNGRKEIIIKKKVANNMPATDKKIINVVNEAIKNGDLFI